MKILFVTTISNTVNAFFIPHIKLLIGLGHQVDVAFNIFQDVNPELIELGCKVHKIEFQRTPLNKKNYLAYKHLKKLVKQEGYDLVHTHTPIASVCVRLACRKNNNVKVIYTAHGFHFYKGAPLINWLIYYPLERWLAKYTDVLITINQEDYTRVKGVFMAKRIVHVPGVGIDLEKYNEKAVKRLTKRKELDIPEDSFVVLSVGELNKNKNHSTIIRAIAELNNPNVYYIICGEGNLKSNLVILSKELGLEGKVKFLGFRKDIIELCRTSDVFVFPSFREGLSVSLMEAMSSGLPVICSKIRGNTDLIEEEKGGYLLEPSDVNGFYNSVKKLYESSELRKKFGENNSIKVQEYSLNRVLKTMKRIYHN